MKRKLMLLALCAVSCSVCVAAQSITTDTNKAPKGRTGDTLIVIGCVDDGGESGSYMLTNAVMRGTPKARPTPAPNGGTVGIRYTLIGPELQAHVGQKVEVTGSMEPSMNKRPTNSSKNDKAATTARAMNGTLTVTSLKMISPTCP
jgi:hypothetical protein